jgi:transposase
MVFSGSSVPPGEICLPVTPLANRRVASRFYFWRRKGIWVQRLAALQHQVDSTITRSHYHATGAKGGETKLLASVGVDSAPRFICAVMGKDYR